MHALRHIKGTELPPMMIEKFNVTPYHTFTLTLEDEVEYDDEGNPLPPESAFRPEFVAEVERRCTEDDRSKSTVCNTEEEIDAFFQKLMDEDDVV